MNFKLGFGPMSDIVVDTLLSYAQMYQKPLMIIASRNQVDSNGGYVMSTNELATRLNFKYSEYIMLCRDHCGPYFLDNEKTMSQTAALEATKKTIATDIESGFGLIHIDTSRCEDPYSAAAELFEFSLKLQPNIQFEFGTEENIGVAAGVEKYKKDVQFAKQFPNVQFIVGQTGSLTMEDRQVGTFELDTVKKLVEYAEQNNVKFKEHNADYLTADQIVLRKTAGVHACNIAPQLGVIQTRTILKLAEYYGVNSADFKERTLYSGKWAKWMLGNDNETRIAVAGHYCYRTNEYLRLEEQLSGLCNIKRSVSSKIEDCLNLYYQNLE